jgi:pimeloyl-ACP methyl ester carboxylesterase
MRLTINGSDIDYFEEGEKSGLPVVFIHPFPFSKEFWRPQIESLGKSFRAVAYDVRGMGLSEPGNLPLTIEQCVDDLFGLLDGLEARPSVLVGMSMGGYIALRAVEREQTRFRALVLCATRSEADSDETKLGRARRARDIKTEGISKFARETLPLMVTPKNAAEKGELRSRLIGMIEKNSPDALAGMLTAMAARTDTTGSLSKIKIPTLIMAGRFDPLIPPSSLVSLKENIPGSRLELISEAAHLPSAENPSEFNNHLKIFIDSVGRQAGGSIREE